MVNQIHIGIKREVEPTDHCLFIDDEVRPIPQSKIFDPTKHSFNPLLDLTYRKACDLVAIFDALFPAGENTLTKETGLECIAEALDAHPSSWATLIPEPHKKSTTGELWAYGKVRRLLRSPVLRKMLTGKKQFYFNPRALIFARVNRAELGEWDSLAVALFLMAHYKQQLVVPSFGFYGRDLHSVLIRENRLIAGVSFLDDLPEKLRRGVLSIPAKTPAGALYDDAVLLAKYAGHLPQTNAFNDYVHAACS